MEKSKQYKILFRYFGISAFILILCCLVIGKMIIVSTIENKHWEEKAAKLKRCNVEIAPLRGNILSTNNEILASTVPQYQLFFDFRTEGIKADTLYKYVKPLAKALSIKLNDKKAETYEKDILKAYKNKKGRFRISNVWVSYLDYQEIKEFPYINKGVNKSGFFIEKRIIRKKPFGAVASRTIGKLDDTIGVYGIEQAYNTELKGTPGVADLEKIRRVMVERTKIEAIPGQDIRTTIDVQIQSITEQALLNKLKEVDADVGAAIVMEVATGEVRAIANYQRKNQGKYVEARNNAIADMVEPGSTFKTVAVMAVLDEGIASSEEIFDTGNGVYPYTKGKHTRYINDWNKHRGGYGPITLAQAIHYSSNIGIAKAVLKGYENNQKGFIEKLKEMGVCDSVDLKMAGQAYPKIPHPDTFRGWNFTTLPWMSFGYNVQIPPIYTLMFYNAIANNGKMLAPIFVSDIIKNGEVVKHIDAKVVREQICKPQTLKEVRKMLTGVVESGTAKNLLSPYVTIAGKTGTAQISQGGAGYKSGETTHRVSFCGYFPDNENPKYSCIVVVTRPRGVYPSAGAISGEVVKKIAEQMYAQGYLGLKPSYNADSIHSLLPDIKRGLAASTISACDSLRISYDGDYITEDINCLLSNVSNNKINFAVEQNDSIGLPSVIGMGLKDALYTLERLGLTVYVKGKGVVTEQDPAAYSKYEKGDKVIINLQQ